MLPFNWDGSHDVGRGAWISGVMASRGFPFGCQVVSKLKRKVRVLNERNEIVLELDVDLEWSPARLASAVLRVLYGHIVPARPCAEWMQAMVQGPPGTNLATGARCIGAQAMSVGQLGSLPCAKWSADSLRDLVAATWASPASRRLGRGAAFDARPRLDGP